MNTKMNSGGSVILDTFYGSRIETMLLTTFTDELSTASRQLPKPMWRVGYLSS